MDFTMFFFKYVFFCSEIRMDLQEIGLRKENYEDYEFWNMECTGNQTQDRDYRF